VLGPGPPGAAGGAAVDTGGAYRIPEAAVGLRAARDDGGPARVVLDGERARRKRCRGHRGCLEALATVPTLCRRAAVRTPLLAVESCACMALRARETGLSGNAPWAKVSSPRPRRRADRDRPPTLPVRDRS